MTYDPALSGRSIDDIWALWQRKTGSILVPGHDVPLVLSEGQPAYVGERRAGFPPGSVRGSSRLRCSS